MSVMQSHHKQRRVGVEIELKVGPDRLHSLQKHHRPYPPTKCGCPQCSKFETGDGGGEGYIREKGKRESRTGVGVSDSTVVAR